MRKLRLMQITHDLAIGGLQRVVANICRAIDRDQFEVSVLALRALGPFAAEIDRLEIPVTLLPQKARGPDYLSFLKVARILRVERPDVIHTHNTQPLMDGTAGVLLTGRIGIVHTDHGRQFPDKRRYMLAERWLSRRIYRVVGVSEDTSRQLVRWEKIDPARVMTIPNGVDCGDRSGAEGKAELRSRIGVGGAGPVIGAVGRLSEEKGVGWLLRAMPAVLAREPAARLVVVGDGPEEPDLRALVSELGIGRSVTFLGPRGDVARLLAAFDVYVLPSLREGLPMAILEAMAAGLPVVASSVGGVPSVVEEGVTGLLVPPKDPDRLAAAICSALVDDRLRLSCSVTGPRLVRSRYSTAAMTRQYERLYREAIDAGQG
jgi:glycosyltransferase involved in cell wall biosynthesis